MVKTVEHEDKGTDTDLVTYELGYHLVPSLSETDLALRVAELSKAIADIGGTIISDGYPQACVLSYTIRKMRGGKWDSYDTSFFGWVRFNAPAEGVAPIKDVADHNEFMVRYLILKLPRAALITPPSVIRRVVESGEVEVEPKALVKRVDEEEKVEVSEEELDKQIEQLIS